VGNQSDYVMSIYDLLGIGNMANWQNAQMQSASMCFMHNERFIGNMCPQCANAAAQIQSGINITNGTGTVLCVPGKINIPPSCKKKSKVLLLLNH
jgi:hypothetical protein